MSPGVGVHTHTRQVRLSQEAEEEGITVELRFKRITTVVRHPPVSSVDVSARRLERSEQRRHVVTYRKPGEETGHILSGASRGNRVQPVCRITVALQDDPGRFSLVGGARESVTGIASAPESGFLKKFVNWAYLI